MPAPIPDLTTNDVVPKLRLALNTVADVLSRMPSAALTNGTPCADWDVAAVIDHVLGEVMGAPKLLAGGSPKEMRPQTAVRDGGDPVALWEAASRDVISAFEGDGALTQMVDLGLGDFPASELGWLLVTDLTIHAWDIARGAGTDIEISDELAAVGWRRLEAQQTMLGMSGAYGEARVVSAEAPLLDRLLALSGRDPAS